MQQKRKIIIELIFLQESHKHLKFVALKYNGGQFKIQNLFSATFTTLTTCHNRRKVKARFKLF